MQYTIKNEDLTVEISDLGGELMSIKSADGTEYLWQGDSNYWAGKAYNLFPIVGRLTEGKYTYKNKTYEMNLHGFVRKSVLQTENQKNDSITFVCKSNETTKKMYPFDFEYKIIYTLNKNSLITTYQVKNTGKESLIFTVGGHPGFNVPLTKNENFEDYYLEFEDKRPAKEIEMSKTCYLTDKEKDFKLENGKILKLKHNLFDNDAIVLKDMSKKVTLKTDKNNKSVTVEYPDMKYLGIWHKPKSDAPYVCIEPWASLPSYDKKIDDLETKRDMEKLDSNKIYNNTFTITIE